MFAIRALVGVNLMDTTDGAGVGEAEARRDVVAKLRRQVVTGCYEPPADVLAERIVQLVLARHTRIAESQG
jgi:hypothetical protein